MQLRFNTSFFTVHKTFAIRIILSTLDITGLGVGSSNGAVDTRGHLIPPHELDHLGAHHISPHQQSFFDPNTGHIHHFAEPPPHHQQQQSGGILSDIAGLFTLRRRRNDGGGSGGGFFGGLRNRFRTWMYGPRVAHRRRYKRQASNIQGNIIRLLKVKKVN